MISDDFDPLDELVTAYLDDEATPEERAQVDGDPALLAKVQEWSALRSAWSVVPAVPADERDAAVLAAIAALDEPVDVSPATPAGRSAATPLEGRRQRRLAYVSWLGAAAAVLAVVLVVSRLGGSDDSNSDLASSSPADTTAAAAAEIQAKTYEASASDTTAAALGSIDAAAESSLDTAAGDAAPTNDAPANDAVPASTTTAAAAAGGGDTSSAAGPGPVIDTEVQLRELATSVQAENTQVAASSAAPAPGAESRLAQCAATLGGLDGGPLVWQGVAAELVLVPTADGTDAVVVDADCVIRVQVPL